MSFCLVFGLLLNLYQDFFCWNSYQFLLNQGKRWDFLGGGSDHRISVYTWQRRKCEEMARAAIEPVIAGFQRSGSNCGLLSCVTTHFSVGLFTKLHSNSRSALPFWVLCYFINPWGKTLIGSRDDLGFTEGSRDLCSRACNAVSRDWFWPLYSYLLLSKILVSN
jgi:hypothetical protein